MSEDDLTTNKITITSIEDIPTLGGNSPIAKKPAEPKKQKSNVQPAKLEQSPLSFEFIGPSRAIQKKLQINKKGPTALQEFPPKIDLEKLKEYRKKSGPAPKLFMPTEEDKSEAEINADENNEIVDMEVENDANGNIETVVQPVENLDHPKPKPENHQNPKRSSRSRSRSRSRSYSRSRSRSYSYSSSSRSRSRTRSRTRSRSRSRSRKRSRSYTPDIPIRRGSPSFLEKRRITR